MGLNCMLEKKEKNTMYKKKLHFQMFGVFLFCYLDGHLSCCASCPFLKKGNLKRVLRRAFLFFFFFFLQRWSVCLFFFLARENHWPSLSFFFLLFLYSDKGIVKGVLCLQRMLLGVSAHQSLQLFI